VMGVAVVAVAVAVVHRPPLFVCGCSAAPDPSSLCTCYLPLHRLGRCPPLFVTDVRDVFSYSTHFQHRNSLHTDGHELHTSRNSLHTDGRTDGHRQTTV
jgi:hypothetical protein